MVATSYWQVNLSRFGYRAIVLPPLLALTFGSLLRGLRVTREASISAFLSGGYGGTSAPAGEPPYGSASLGQNAATPAVRGWGWFALAGAWAGLSAYTYSSVRVLPVLLLLVWVWAMIADRRQWRSRLLQFLLFGLVAAVVFAPLGLFFLRNPEAFAVRLEQVSVFSPAVNQGDPWGTLWRTVRLAFGMFTVSGDMNPLYNYPGKPVFDPVLGLAFYLGLGVCAWRLLAKKPDFFSQTLAARTGAAPSPVETRADVQKSGFWSRLPYFLLLAWIPVMMVPNVLSARGVPHNLRAMALIPAVYGFAAIGIVTVVQGSTSLAGRSLFPWLAGATLVLMTVYAGLGTYRDYAAWAGSAAPYFKGNTALIHAAELLNEHREADPYVATYFHQHATLAVYARDYRRIRWMSGGTLVLPPPGAPPALLVYDHTNPIDPVLRERYLRPETLLHRELGPDGEIGFEAFLLDPKKPDFSNTCPGGQCQGKSGFYPDASMDVNLGNTLSFLGYDLNAPVVSGDTLDVNLYYRVQRQVDRDDFTFFAHLVDDLGFRWAGQTFFYYPSAQWREGEAIAYRLQMPIAPGAPPGSNYHLNLGVHSPSLDARLPVLNEAGQTAGTVISVEPIQVSRAATPPDERPAIMDPQEIHFGEALTFLGSDRDRGDLLPGQTLALTLYWEASEIPHQAHQVKVSLFGPAGEIVLWQGHPVHGLYPFARWQPGEFLRDRYALRLPIDTPTGDYDLRLALLAVDDQPIPTGDGGRTLSLGTIHVHASDRLWEPPPFAHPVGARLGEAFELLGYGLDHEQVRPGQTLHLTLVWRCREMTDTSYTVFTHLLDAGEQIRGQKDNPPVDGSYPTTLWVPGEIVVDRYAIPVAADAAPGKHAIEVGMYDPATILRLPVLDPSGAAGDRILLADVEVVP